MHVRAATLDVHDPATLAPFWADILGLPVTRAADGVVIPIAGARLALRAAPDAHGAHHVALRVAADRLDAAHAWLAGRTPLLRHQGAERVPWRHWEAGAVYASDPDGNVIELIAFAGLPQSGASGPFGPDELLGIAEVGLAVDDVLSAAATLERDAGLVSWDGDAPSPGFAALGSRGASLIVVPLDRPWFPTAHARSGTARVEVAFGGAPRDGVAAVGTPGHGVTVGR